GGATEGGACVSTVAFGWTGGSGARLAGVAGVGTAMSRSPVVSGAVVTGASGSAEAVAPPAPPSTSASGGLGVASGSLLRARLPSAMTRSPKVRETGGGSLVGRARAAGDVAGSGSGAGSAGAPVAGAASLDGPTRGTTRRGSALSGGL